MVVIVVGAGLLLVTIAMFERFLMIRGSGQNHLERQLIMSQLAEQFRDDVWDSDQVAKSSANDVTLRSASRPDQRIEYHLDQQSVERTELIGNTVQSRESFDFLDAMPIGFEIDQSGAEPRASLRIAPLKTASTNGENRQGKPLRISATLARNNRFIAKGAAP
jgi:hypothetical protein